MNQEKAVGGQEDRGVEQAVTPWDTLGEDTRAQSGATAWGDLKNEQYPGDTRQEKLGEDRLEVLAESGAENQKMQDVAEGVPAETDLAMQRLAVVKAAKETKKPVAEMSSQEIAREYLDVLRGLGENFTSPEGKSGKVVLGDGTVTERNYAGDKEFVERIYGLGGMKGEETAEDLDKALNLRMVDSILESEQKWRDAGEEHAAAEETIAKSEERLEKLAKEGKSMGLLGKLRTFGARRKEKKELQAKIMQAQAAINKADIKTKKSDQKLGENLRAAYSEDYHYGSHQDSLEHRRDKEHQEQTNEAHNQTFFEGHEAEIKRAIELRKALLDLKHGKIQSERPQVDDWYDSLQR